MTITIKPPTRVRKPVKPRTCCASHGDRCRFGREHRWVFAPFIDRSSGHERWVRTPGAMICADCSGICIAEVSTPGVPCAHCGVEVQILWADGLCTKCVEEGITVADIKPKLVADLSALETAAETLSKATSDRAKLIVAARIDGYSWPRIATAAQLSKQAVLNIATVENGGVLPVPRQRG